MLSQPAQFLPTGGATHASLLRLWLPRAVARAGQPFRTVARKPVRARAQGLAMRMPWPVRHVRAEADDLYRGAWRLAGCEVRTAGRVVFDIADAPSSWREELHRFDWLFVLLGSRRQLWRMAARTLVLDWMARLRNRGLEALALRPGVLGRRLVNMVAAAPALLDEADREFVRQFHHGITVQARLLLRATLAACPAQERLEACMARAWLALGVMGFERLREPMLQALAEELQRQFLPDGGHVSRSPAMLLDALATLVPLRTAVEQAGLAVPMPLQEAIEKGLPMLRLLRHADGGLALFQGVREPHYRLLHSVLELDAAAGAPLEHARHSGFARMARGRSVLIADVGSAPPASDNPAATLSALAFEFSHNGHRIVTGCGAPFTPEPELDLAARMSAAHSMPVLGGADAGELMDTALARRLFDTPPACGPRVAAELTGSRMGALLEAEHDAWARFPGFETRRRLFLAADGEDLRGEDAFVPVDGTRAQASTFIIRFHLHPAVTATLSRDGRSVMLRLPDRSGWTFTARNATLALEESLFMADPHGLRRTSQIVLRGACPEAGAAVQWKLARIATSGRMRRARARAEAAPSLPLE